MLLSFQRHRFLISAEPALKASVVTLATKTATANKLNNFLMVFSPFLFYVVYTTPLFVYSIRFLVFLSLPSSPFFRMTISTLLFCCLPALVAFEARGTENH
jgi:hypothetical protein